MNIMKLPSSQTVCVFTFIGIWVVGIFTDDDMIPIHAGLSIMVLMAVGSLYYMGMKRGE